MLTDTETMSLKKQILRKIADRYEELILSKQLDEAQATEVFNFIQNKIVPADLEKTFSRNIREFCEKFPGFKQIGLDLQQKRDELICKIGQECLENLMGQKMDEYMKLAPTLEVLAEATLEQWVAQLAPEQRSEFMTRLIASSTK